MTIKPYYEQDGVTLYLGDCREVMRALADCSVDAVVTDPPYELGFMGKRWDRSGIAYDASVWSDCLRVLKPGGHLLAFGGSRTYHRLACAIEDAGFEIRDDIDFWYDANPVFADFYNSLNEAQKQQLHQSAGASHLSWIYGSGFPKSLDVSKAIDAAAGIARELVERVRPDGKLTGHAASGFVSGIADAALMRDSHAVTDAAKQWNGWGTALKPAHEPIVLARKPLIGTVAQNILEHGTGGLNINGCRVDGMKGNGNWRGACDQRPEDIYEGGWGEQRTEQDDLGRWPANVIHDGSDGVLAAFPDAPGQQGDLNGHSKDRLSKGIFGDMKSARDAVARLDSGSAARFFYCSKASQEDRNEGLEDLAMLSAGAVTDRKDGSAGLNSPRAGAGRTNGSRNPHPTVKPTELMRYLCRLITPPGGTVLDPFCGSGSTGKAAMLEGLKFIGIEFSTEYCELTRLRIEAVTKQGQLFK